MSQRAVQVRSPAELLEAPEMIDDVLVIDAVAHGVDLSRRNWNYPPACEPFAEHGYYGLHAKYVPADEPQWTMPQDRYLAGTPADPEVLAHAFFAESWTDAVIYHGVPMFGMFKEGLSPLRTGLEMRERHPGRVEIYGPVSPFLPNAVDEVDRLVEEVGVRGLKIYPADVFEGRVRTLRMDDPELVYPILERARQRGIKVVAVHKALPLGPVPTDPFRVEDMDASFYDFPDLHIEIVHGGAAFLEETAMQLARFPNALVNLEATSAYIMRTPRRFARILAAFLAAGAEDRIIWGTGCSAIHPQPALERFWNLEIPQDLLEEHDLPQITRETKRKILGGNIARVLGLDLDRIRAAAGVGEHGGHPTLAPPWSGRSKVEAA